MYLKSRKCHCFNKGIIYLPLKEHDSDEEHHSDEDEHHSDEEEHHSDEEEHHSDEEHSFVHNENGCPHIEVATKLCRYRICLKHIPSL